MKYKKEKFMVSFQGFLNSVVIGQGKSPFSEGMGNVTGGDFLTEWSDLMRCNFDKLNLSFELKTTFCNY